MRAKDSDKIPTQKDLKSSESADPVSDENTGDPKPNSPEDPQKETANVPQETTPEMSDHATNDQTVSEALEEENDAAEAVVENSADRKTEKDAAAFTTTETGVDNQANTPVSEESSPDESTDTAQDTDETPGDDKNPDPELQDQDRSHTDKTMDDRSTPDTQPDPGSAAEEDPENENELSESENNSADENPEPIQESIQTDDTQSLDADAKNPNTTVSAESADQALNAEKESDAVEENKEKRSSEKDLDDTSEDKTLADSTLAESAAPDADASSIKDEDQDSAAEIPTDTMDDALEEDRFEYRPNDTEAETEDLPEWEPKKKVSFLKAALTIIIVAAAFSGFFIFDNKSNIKSAKRTESSEVLSAKAGQKNTKPAIDPDDPNYIYYAKIDEISTLRDMLLRKNEEISELKKQYQSGIEELEKEILDELQHLAGVTFWQAIENKRIEFRLRTIQRRLAYIRQLDRPAKWAFKASEDLLYIKRKALMDIQVAEVASGIDMNMHVRHMNTALNKYRPTSDKLAVDMTDAPAESLKSIWQRIEKKRVANASQLAYSKNQIISEQICTGNFSRLAELSEISVDSAKCIVEMQGSDLFLNGLTEISPSAARQLFQWKGNWICLNGFKALSPRVAAYLFKWDGSWISLNGLTDFPPEFGNLLLQWGGSQLELMGLRHTDSPAAKNGIKYLAQWERSGGKLYVPKSIRKIIAEINANPA